MFKSCRQITIARFYSTPNEPKAPSDAADDAESDIIHLNDRDDIWIPEYPKRPDEPLEKRRQRYVFQSLESSEFRFVSGLVRSSLVFLQIIVPESQAWNARERFAIEYICCQIFAYDDRWTSGNVRHINQ